MRSTAIFEQVVPLRPRFDSPARALDDDDAVAELGRRRRRLFTERSPEAGEVRRQLIGQLQLAAVGDEDSVRRFREDSSSRAPNVAGFRECQRLPPTLDDIVRPSPIVATFFLQEHRSGEGPDRYRRQQPGDCPAHLQSPYANYGFLKKRSPSR